MGTASLQGLNDLELAARQRRVREMIGRGTSTGPERRGELARIIDELDRRTIARRRAA